MRILQAVHALPADTVGGTEVYTRDLAEALSAVGHDVTIAAARGAGTAIDGVDVVELPTRDRGGVQTDRGLPYGALDPRRERRFVSVLESVDPDIVHLQHVKGLSALIPALCARHDVASVATLHDFWAICHREQLVRSDGVLCAGPESVEKCTACLVTAHHGPRRSPGSPAHRTRAVLEEYYAEAVALRWRQLGRCLAGADRLVAPSRFLRDVLCAHGVDPGSIVHCRNGIDTEPFEDSGFDPRSVRVGYAGRIVPEKGVHLLLESFGRIDGNATLEIFGRFEPETNAYHERLASMAGEDAQFHGYYDDPGRPYREMDVFVLPSLWYENSPIVIQEAFASRVPVVTADAGGMAELVTDGVDGLTFAIGDGAGLSRVLDRLIGAPGLIERLRDGIEAPRSLDEHVSGLTGIYRRCVRPNGSEGP